MKTHAHAVKLIGFSLLVLCAPSFADENEVSSLSEMVTKGKASVNFRYRFEGVEQDGFDEDAQAALLRSRLTLSSAELNGFSALLEVDNVTSIGADDYNSTENGKPEFPVVADPEGTDLNQVWVRYSFEDGNGTLGRQRINHGSQRFVGSVAWRQNEQTMDALRLDLKPMENLRIDLSYVDTINRIFGPDDGAQPAEWKGDTALARVDYAPSGNHKLAAFGYLLDVEEQEGFPPGRTVNASNNTLGAEYQGTFGMFGLNLGLATQSDAGDSQRDYDAYYYLVEGALNFKHVSIKLGQEVLASDNGVGFQTPLATLHKFNGWADKFLATPGDGLEDTYVNISGKAGPVRLSARYHLFAAESSSADFGQEFNLIATWPVNKVLTLQGKFATFATDDDTRYTDTDKLWLTAQVKL